MAEVADVFEVDVEQLENFTQFLKRHFDGQKALSLEIEGDAGNGEVENIDEIDGFDYREDYSSMFDATLSADIAPELYFNKKPVIDIPEKCAPEKKLASIPIEAAEVEKLKEAESKVLQGIPGYKEEFDFDIADVKLNNGIEVHTAHFYSLPKSNDGTDFPPIVMLHGTGGGIPCFHKIYRELVKRRQIYAIDIPGFGLSSRINYSSIMDTCEDQLEGIIESWRVKKKLDKMVLFGHSFGAYICTLYAIQHFNHVDHLTLIDPWGMLSKTEHVYSQGLLYELFRKFCEGRKFNPMKFFPNFGTTIGGLLIDVYMANTSYGPQCMEYFRRAGTTGEMSGLKALLVLSDFQVDYPLRPLRKRLQNLFWSFSEPTLPVTFILGEKSVYKNPGAEQVRDGAKEHAVTVLNVPEAGHHVHADKPDVLVKHMLDFVIND